MSLSDQHRSRLAGTGLLLILLLCSFLLNKTEGLQRIDLLVYDLLLPVQAPAMSEQILIIDIDDASVNELGRWPWSRQLHSQLLENICQYQPRAIGFDILFPEPETPATDNTFAKAIAACGNVFLAVAPYQETPQRPISELLPITTLAIAAAGLGHVDAELDIDGLSRRYHLWGGIGDPHWPIIALGMVNYDIKQPLDYKRLQRDESKAQVQTGWVRNYRGLIPYTLPSDQARRVSYADVLSGRINNPELFRDKYLLIGASSSGIGDMISTPAYQQHQPMPGVLLMTQVLNGLLQQQIMVNSTKPQAFWLSAALVTLGFMMVTLCSVRLGFLVSLIASGFAIAVSAILLALQYRWFAPSATVLSLLLSWPLWTFWSLGIQSRLNQKLQTRLTHLTRHHPQTGLPNQGKLEDQLSKLVGNIKHDSYAALIMCQFNWPDSATGLLGRAQGNQMFEKIAKQLQIINTEDHLLAHLNGDDFAFVLRPPHNVEDTLAFAERIIETFKKPLNPDQDSLILSPYMGISTWPSDGLDASTLIRNASTAMFKSRLLSDRQYCLYSEEIGQELQTQSELEQALLRALERDEFDLYYQPQVDIATRQIIGAEALLRWHNYKLGWVSPGDFIPVAEHTGLIGEIGDWVLKTACDQLRHLNQQGHKGFRMAVNISPLQFCSPDLVHRIKWIILQSGVNPKSLEFEITESTLMTNMDSAVRAMKELSEFGIQFAIDDFGTGYSSLNHLQTFPLTRLKLDQSFTREIGHNNNATEITLGIIRMAQRLKLEVIAEGVEEKSQAAFLEAHQCHELQGYLFSRPVPKTTLEKLLQQGLDPKLLVWS